MAFHILRKIRFFADLEKEAYHLKNVFHARAAHLLPFFRPGRHVLVLTNLCNLRCPHCFQAHKKSAGAMDEADWLRVIGQLPRKSIVTITGGEPLIFKGFRNIFEKAAENHPCNVITNGTLLNEENMALLLGKKNFRVLGVSIDGLKETMRKVRTLEHEDFEKLVKSLRRFVEMRKETGSFAILNIKTVILDENAEELYDFHRFVKEEIGADTHDLYFLKGSPLQHADAAYPMEECFKPVEPPGYAKKDIITEQLEKIFAYDDKDSGIKTFLHPKVPMRMVGALLEGRFNPSDYKKCIFPWSSLHINFNGEVYPCLSVLIGNVKRQSMGEIYKGDAYRAFLKEINRHGILPACARCGWLRPVKRQ